MAGRKIAIIGTAGDLGDVPLGDEWERWACHWSLLERFQNLVADRYEGTGKSNWPTLGRVYELHDALTRDAECIAALQPNKRGETHLYAFDADAHFVSDVTGGGIRVHRLEHAPLVDRFGSYFTNSVAWMLGHALQEHQECRREVTTFGDPQPVWVGHVEEIAVYGINMATAKEFGHERPSVEYMLGWARGLGIKVTIPEASDLLHCGVLYGLDQETWYEHKLMAERLRIADQIREMDESSHPYSVHALRSTLWELEYLQRVRFHTRVGEGGAE